MADDHYQIVAILVKYAMWQPLDEEELCVLAEWRSRSEEHAVLPEQLRDRRWVREQRERLHQPPTAAMWADIRDYIDQTGEAAPADILPGKRRIGYRWLPAAVIIGLVVLTGYWRWSRTKVQGLLQAETPATVTGVYKALLTLEDGSVIVLDTVKKGIVVVKEGNIQLRKADSNSYVYEDLIHNWPDASINRRELAGGFPLPTKWARHRITIANGAGIYRLQWPDGSRVWMRQGSSLKYPVDGRSALWELTGEAWFRVTHDVGRPFAVCLPDGAITRVLGTSFEIKTAGAGSNNRVSLFDGAVRVVKGTDSVMLKPGSQVETGTRGIKEKEAIDSNEVLTWLRPKVKDSLGFDFENADLLTLLPEVADWYRVLVINPARLTGVAITAGYPRSLSLEMIIRDIQHFEDAHVRIRRVTTPSSYCR